MHDLFDPASCAAWPMDVALRMASRGLRVFPVKRNDKVPLSRHSFHDASRDPMVIKLWRGRFPRANYGIHTGSQSGVWVLDVDVKKAADGRETLAELEEEHGELEGVKVYTPGGGFHFFFTWNEAAGIKSRVGPLAGIDLRGEGGYVVGPGSSINGRPYYFDDSARGRKIGPAPQWLIEELRNPKEREAVAKADGGEA